MILNKKGVRIFFIIKQNFILQNGFSGRKLIIFLLHFYFVPSYDAMHWCLSYFTFIMCGSRDLNDWYCLGVWDIMAIRWYCLDAYEMCQWKHNNNGNNIKKKNWINNSKYYYFEEKLHYYWDWNVTLAFFEEIQTLGSLIFVSDAD